MGGRSGSVCPTPCITHHTPHYMYSALCTAPGMIHTAPRITVCTCLPLQSAPTLCGLRRLVASVRRTRINAALGTLRRTRHSTLQFATPTLHRT